MAMSEDRVRALLNALPPEEREAFFAEAAKRLKRGKKKVDYTTQDGIVKFVREKLHIEPTPYQERILRALVEHKRVCVRSPHGAGKTALASWVVLWGMYAFDTDVKIPCTASAWRQLSHFLFPEIRQWARRAKLDNDMRILDLSLKAENKEAFALASDTPSALEGAHASVLIYCFDEAKAIPNDTWDACEGAFSGAGTDTGAQAYALAISTPGEPSGRFHDIQTRRPGYEDWYPIHVTLDECIKSGRISATWAEQKSKQWGSSSAVYLNRVRGEFADSGENSVIPLSWIEAANERYEKCGGKGSGAVSYGLDPARYGDDSTSTAKLVGRVLESLTYHNQQSTMETAGRMVALVQDKTTPIGIDTIGIGSGVYDRLKEIGFRNLKPINASERALDRNGRPRKDEAGQIGFFNLRAALWWAMREALDPESDEPLALPPDDRLTGDLTAPGWQYTSNGRIQVESKPDIKARIGRSTDAADALALALEAARPHWHGFTTSKAIIHRRIPMSRSERRKRMPL